MRLIDADNLLASLRESRDRANVWMSDCREYGSNMTERAEQAVMTFNECILRVKGAPAVDAVQARHGKWVDENGNRPYGYRFNWLCSECGRPQHTSTAKLLKEFEEEHRWCHFCGARMDGKDGDHHANS